VKGSKLEFPRNKANHYTHAYPNKSLGLFDPSSRHTLSPRSLEERFFFQENLQIFPVLGERSLIDG
jgi:hypothetical protein